MDKKFVKRKINEFFGRYEYKELLDRVAEVIVGQHEAELQAARRESAAAVLPCGHHASNAIMDEGGAHCEMCTMQAQVAVMAEALDDAKRFMLEHKIPPKPYGVIQRIDKALSAAPRVLARRKAAYWPEDDTLIFVEGMDALDVGFLIDEGKQMVDVLIVPCDAQ
jgi:hypothetical protein